MILGGVFDTSSTNKAKKNYIIECSFDKRIFHAKDVSSI